MSSFSKIVNRLMLGASDANIKFSELRYVLERLGFSERIKGDHYIYTLKGVMEIINIQPKGAMSKPYQVKQIRNLILKYNLLEVGENGK